MENNFTPPQPLSQEELHNGTHCIIAYEITYDDANQQCKKKLQLVGENGVLKNPSPPVTGNFYDCEDWLHNELRATFGSFFKDPEGFYHGTETLWFKIQPLLRGLPTLYKGANSQTEKAR